MSVKENDKNNYNYSNAELYIMGNRDEALLSLSHKLNKQNMDDIVPMLKQDIFALVSRQRKDFNGNIDIVRNAYTLLSDLDVSEFFARKWKHSPYYLSDHDFSRLQGCVKNPIYVNRYKYDKPIYDFANSRIFDDTRQKLSLSRMCVKSDVQFYLSSKEDILFAKLVSIKYKPKNLKLIREKVDNSTEDNKNILNDFDLYDRSFTISMYVLLDGDPGKPLPFMRYDNDSYPHKNVWVGSDGRKNIFGESAVSPHFHFQNERDGLLCLRKFKSKDKKIKYRTGRCNAIDCKHLCIYLKNLDKKSVREVDTLINRGENYSMPFLNFKHMRMAVNIDVDKIVEKYKQDTSSEGLYAVEKWLEKEKSNEDYLQEKDKCFPDLIKALDFLTYITTRLRVSIDEKEAKALSDLEIVTANNIMDSINLATHNILEVDNKPKYKIDYKFDDEIDLEE